MQGRSQSMIYTSGGVSKVSPYYQCSVQVSTDIHESREMFDSMGNVKKSKSAGLNQLERFQLRKIGRFEKMRRPDDGDLVMTFRLRKNNVEIFKEIITSKVSGKLVIA